MFEMRAENSLSTLYATPGYRCCIASFWTATQRRILRSCVFSSTTTLILCRSASCLVCSVLLPDFYWIK